MKNVQYDGRAMFEGNVPEDRLAYWSSYVDCSRCSGFSENCKVEAWYVYNLHIDCDHWPLRLLSVQAIWIFRAGIQFQCVSDCSGVRLQRYPIAVVSGCS